MTLAFSAVATCADGRNPAGTDDNYDDNTTFDEAVGRISVALEIFYSHRAVGIV